jgi:hypothetical protein
VLTNDFLDHRFSDSTIMSTAQPPPSGAFSTSGEDAITRTVEIKQNELTSDDVQQDNLDELFEIVETAQAIEEGNYKQVRFTTRSLS